MLEKGFANMFGCTASPFYYTAIINLIPISTQMLWINYNYNALKPRLKRERFSVNVKTLRKSMDISTDPEPEQVKVANPWPAWKTKHRNNQWYRVKISDQPFRYQHRGKRNNRKNYPRQE